MPVANNIPFDSIGGECGTKTVRSIFKSKMYLEVTYNDEWAMKREFEGFVPVWRMPRDAIKENSLAN